MTTFQQEHIQAFKTDVILFSRKLDSFVQTLSPIQTSNNLMMNELPENPQDTPITERQKTLLVDLVHQKFSNKAEKERWLVEIETMSKFDASEAISSMLMGAR